MERVLVLPTYVSELAWYIRHRVYLDRQLDMVKALRRGADEWVVWDGRQPASFMTEVDGHAEWFYVPRDEDDDPGRCREPLRYSTAQVVEMAPRLLLDQARSQWGRRIDPDELYVVEGFVPDEAA